MREGASSEVLAGAAGWWPEAASWRDGQLLAGDVPIVSGRMIEVGSQRVPSRITFAVPDWDHGTSWVPDTADHPLSKYGSTIDLRIMVWSSVEGQPTATRMGRFRVHSWDHDDNGLVQVEARCVLQAVDEFEFTVPEAPRSGGTLFSELRRLMIPGVPVSIDPALVDRACPSSFQWSSDRLGALYDIVDAIPARMLPDQWGGVQILAPLPDVPSPVMTLSDGLRGTVVKAPRGDTREGSPNVLVATSTSPELASADPLMAVARISSGPMAATDDGTGYGQVVRRWSTPLATSLGALQASANTMRDRMARPTVVRSVMHAPDPRIELDDAIAVTSGGRTEWGYVVATEIPLTVDGGQARTDVGVLS
jgi:hypothetical protein